ncbi:MAG: endonuclease/exonuclease/phosphatase family protein [Terriglobia bacterium]
MSYRRLHPGRFRALLLVLPLLVPLSLTLAGQAERPLDSGLRLEVQQLLPPPAVSPATIRIVTFNVHRGLDVPRLATGIQSVSSVGAADVFLLQEIESCESEGISRAHKLAETLRMNYVYAPARSTEDGGTHGLAILSRFRITDVQVIPLKQYKLVVNTRRRIALAATLDVAGQPLRVYNVHLDTRLNTGDRIEQVRAAVEAARDDRVAAVVVGGDFNTNPVRWAFHILPLFRSNQAAALDAFMEESGFHTPLGRNGATLNRRLLKFRADSLYSRGLAVAASGVERSVKVSDHFPVWMEVAWPPQEKGAN